MPNFGQILELTVCTLLRYLAIVKHKGRKPIAQFLRFRTNFIWKPMMPIKRNIIEKFRDFLALTLICVFSFCFSGDSIAQNSVQASSNGRVFSIKLEQSSIGTIINLRMDKSIDYKLFTLTSPSHRLVIDFKKLEWAMGRGQAGEISGKGLISKLRFAQKSDTESRLVLDLNGPIKILSQNYSGVAGSKNLRIEIAKADNGTFSQIAPKKVTKILPVPSPIAPKFSSGKYVIVIDAGHGGHDPGALGFTKGVYEKNITLKSALQLAEFLKKDKRFQVVLTRSSDEFLSLEKRIIVARDIRADLFISLHADAAAPNSKAQGATVYTLSESGGERSRKLLDRENWAIVPTNSSKDNIVTEILRDLTQRDTKNQSAAFAEMVIKHVKGVGPLTSSSHRSAGFFVLLSPTVPAVLFEMGFITDPNDQARLIDDGFRKKQMQGVAKAITEYFDTQQIKLNGAKGK